VHPWSSPSVFCECVDAAPRSNDEGIEELLAPSSPPQPHLSDQKQDQEDYTVCDESASHNEVCQTLSGVVRSAEAKCSDTSKEELHPRHHGHGLSDNAVRLYYHMPYLSIYAFFKVQLQVDAHGDLGYEHEHDDWYELGMDVLGELSAFMPVAEEVADDCEDGS
jgi:hypothetical protein